MNNNLFKYEAYDNQGNLSSGQLSAESEREVVVLLQRKKLIPVKVEVAKQGISFSSKKTISNSDLIEFTNGLTTLIEARVPIDRALLLLEGLTDKQHVKQLVSDLRRDVKEGKSLADTMEARPEVFTKMYVNIVRAGEEGGMLEELLPGLASFLADAEETRRQVISALTYPAFLFFVGIITVVGLLLFMVPQFATMFENAKNIPPSAALLLAMSEWLESYGWTLLLLPFAIFYAWRWLGATEQRRIQRDQHLLSLPLFGTLFLLKDTATFSRTLGALMNAGVPLIKGLRIAKEVIENNLLRQSLANVEKDVRSGMGLGQALERVGKFPTLLHQLIVVGEESGRTASILQKLAETFDRYVKNQVARLVSLLQPTLTVLLGVGVGGIIAVMMVAVFSMNDIGF